MSGLRQVVLALLTLSNDGCRSLHRHNMAVEREIRTETEPEMETKCTRTEDASRGVRKMRTRTKGDEKEVEERKYSQKKERGRRDKERSRRPSDSAVTCNACYAVSPFIIGSHSSQPYIVIPLRWKAGELPWEPGLSGRGDCLCACVCVCEGVNERRGEESSQCSHSLSAAYTQQLYVCHIMLLFDNTFN